MIAFAFGTMAAITFVTFMSAIHAWMEMRFDQRATQVFDADDTRTEEELTIIHKNQLPIRLLVLVLTPLVGDMQAFWPTLALALFGVCIFWICFDIFCAVVWLGKPWYYVGDPPPFGMNPYMYFFLKGILMAICLFAYIRWST